MGKKNGKDEMERYRIDIARVRSRTRSHFLIIITKIKKGELAQMARAPALHAGGHRFDFGTLHLNLEDEKSITKDFIRSWIY